MASPVDAMQSPIDRADGSPLVRRRNLCLQSPARDVRPTEADGDDFNMTPNAGGEPPAPNGPQTIVIERREPAGRGRKLLFFLLFTSTLLNMILFAGRTGAGLGRLDERYVAGETLPTGPKVAIVEVTDAIGEGSVEHVLKQIRQAREDSQVKGVVLRVDSPGGTVSGSDQIWREVATLKAREKPVVASFGGMAASGGYYVAAPADLIFAEPTSLVGSIGVKVELLQLHGLMEKVGVDFATIAKGDYKEMGSMYRPIAPEERALWEQLIDDAYQRFIRVVAQGRKLPLAAAKALADGRVFTSDEAIKLKLVDRVGYLDDAIAHVQGTVGLETARVVRYAKPIRLADALISLAGPPASPGFDAATIARLRAPRLLYQAR